MYTIEIPKASRESLTSLVNWWQFLVDLDQFPIKHKTYLRTIYIVHSDEDYLMLKLKYGYILTELTWYYVRHHV